jgi:hypothetical protein
MRSSPKGFPYLFKLDKPSVDLNDAPAASPADFKVGALAAVVFTAKVWDKSFNYNTGKGTDLKVMTGVLVSSRSIGMRL